MIILNDKLNEPLYMQIYRQIKEKIISGKIAEGTKLYSIRTLSNSLDVSTNTVNYAYQQLCLEGYITNKARSGFFVQRLDNQLLFNLRKHNYNKNTENLKSKEYDKPNNTYKYNFQYGKLSPNYFPIYLWRKILNQLLSLSTLENMVSYNERKGEEGLRTEIMNYLHTSRGVSCQLEQIIICSGTQSCLNLICQLLKEHSTDIAIEDPGYDGARVVFINNELNVIPISLEDDGVKLSELKNSDAKIIYTTPSHQFPTGSVMPIQKRLKLLEWAIDNDSIIIEDDYDSELRYTGKPIPSMQSIDSKGRVIYIGTLSKSLSPALRISYMVLPEGLLKRYNDIFKKYVAYVPWLEQKTLEKFMNFGHWETHLRKICHSNKKKHDVLVHTINKLMGEKVIIHGKNAGLHVILEFKNGLSEKDLITRAKNHGVIVYPVSRYWIRLEEYTNNMILLGFSGMSEENIVKGINILNKAWFND